MAAALLLTACGKTNAGSGSSGSMNGSSGTSSAQTQTAAWKTGLGVVTEATDQDRAGKIELAAAAVLLDGEGKLESVLLDELEVSVSADSTGHVTLPTDWRTKRQKGDDYPLAEVSSLKKCWARTMGCAAHRRWARSGTSTARASAMPSRARPAPRSLGFPAAMPT